ncbi:MAG TPA: winged helix-turn-helix domain-containing protein [Mucilaginibacter sp.]|nr:winged helix-turn-helix domain-containing protein [Mucilaginibacter sp.]
MMNTAHPIRQKFILDNRFMVDPGLNCITDMATNSYERLEPRVLHLLCILASNAGQVVTRQYFISAVWNDYGGADEGLSQGISFCAKA